MCTCDSKLFKGISFSPYLTNTVLKVIFELASRICLSLYHLLFENGKWGRYFVSLYKG